MRALSQYFPSSGHFPWCPYRDQDQADHHGEALGCQHCKLLLYGIAIALNFFIAALEFWGSDQTHSASLLADAWHVVSDSLGNIIGVLAALAALRVSKKTGQKKWQKRFEVFAGLFVMCVGFLMFMSSVDRLMARELPAIVQGQLLLGVAVIGLLVNVILLFSFRALRVTHSHGHEEGYEHHKDGVLSANIVHTFGDAAASLGVLFNAALFAVFGDPRIGYLDLTISCLIALWLIKQAWDVLESSAHK